MSYVKFNSINDAQARADAAKYADETGLLHVAVITDTGLVLSTMAQLYDNEIYFESDSFTTRKLGTVVEWAVSDNPTLLDKTTYVKFNHVNDSQSRAELIEVISDRYYENVPIIGKTDINLLVEGIAFLDGDNILKFQHENGEEFGDIVEWAFAENPTTLENNPVCNHKETL